MCYLKFKEIYPTVVEAFHYKNRNAKSPRKSVEFNFWEQVMSVPSLKATDSIFLEIFQSGPKGWTLPSTEPLR